MTVHVSKSNLRRLMRKQLESIPIQDRSINSKALASHVLKLPQWQAAKVVSVYLSMPHEADTTMLVQSALSSGKKIFVPKIISSPSSTSPSQMIMVPLNTIDELNALPLDRYGIPNPPHRTDPASSLIDIIIIPGLAFDRQGHRLGYGKGYYDTWLGHCSRMQAVRVGLAFEAQVLPNPSTGNILEVPTEEHDQLVSLIVTESGAFAVE